MPTKQFTLSGVQAVYGLIAVAALVIFRVMTFDDQLNNETLVHAIEIQLNGEYLSDHVDKLREMYESGTAEEQANVGEYALSTKLNIHSLSVSAPLFDFTSTQQVIVKVTYSVDNNTGTLKSGTEYYRYTHGIVANSWRYEGPGSVASYYLNFM